MIDPALLDRLQKADPETWKRFVDTELFTYNEYDDYGKIEHYVYQEDLIGAAREAWLQHVLQEAIRARGWAMTMTYNPPRGPEGAYWDVALWSSWNTWFQGDMRYDVKADSPAEALLRAYLAAI